MKNDNSRLKRQFTYALALAVIICLLFSEGYKFLRSIGAIGPTFIDDVVNVEDSTSKENNPTIKASDPDFDPTDYSNTAITFVDSQNDTISIPQFDGSSYSYQVNNGNPYFNDSDLASTDTWHTFSDLDRWGRVGVANAVVGPETLQTNARGSLQSFTPSGWEGCKVSLGNGTNTGNQRCERSHLIANKLLGDASDCTENLVTGSHDFNANKDSGMLHWEIQLIDAAEQGYHIRYRVTPVFDEKDSKVAGSVTPHGVLMEAESIEDHGNTVKLCEYVYNVEEGWVCDYTNGEWELRQK